MNTICAVLICNIYYVRGHLTFAQWQVAVFAALVIGATR